MDLRLTRPRKRGNVAGPRLGLGRYRPAGRGQLRRRPRAQSESAKRRQSDTRTAYERSSPRGSARRRAASAHPAGVVEPARTGGGVSRRAIAAPRVHAGGARAGSAPPGPRSRVEPPARRARSDHAHPHIDPRPAPRLRPVFLWARQVDGTLTEVRCEDYDGHNRIRIARTPAGWRVIPCTEIYDSIKLSPPPLPERSSRERRRKSRRRHRKSSKRRSLSPAAACVSSWLPPDLESHIPLHTIPTRAHLSPLPHPTEPTPLDNLLAVAELEFNQQQSCKEGRDFDLDLDASGLHAQLGKYDFLPEEDCERHIMSFEINEPVKNLEGDEMFFEQKSCGPVEHSSEENAYQNNIGVHKDLFETISEAHYLPDLNGPHDEELLESLVEKGCEDNQILGQALDKLAHLVHGTTEYGEEEEDMLLGGAPVSDIIHRLEQSLESPGRSSMTAAQGLLHLHHHIGDHHQHQHQQEHAADQTYLTDELFTHNPSTECSMENLNPESDIQQKEISCEHNMVLDPKEIQNDVTIAMPNVTLSETLPEISYDEKPDNQQSQSLPDQSDVTMSSEMNNESVSTICENAVEMPSEIDESAVMCDGNVTDSETNLEIKKEIIESNAESDELVPTDLSMKHVERDLTTPCVVASAAETTNTLEDNLSEKSDEQPKDLSLHRRLPTPHASPRRLELPRAPSRESDAMQSPQPSGIPAVPSSPELFTMPQSKSNKTLFLESLLSSPSPKMYTSEVTITKQQCEPLNLGKHRKSASPTVSSCSDEIKKLSREYGEPREKRIKRESTEELAKISKVFTKSNDDITESKQKKPERHSSKSHDETSPLKQLQVLKTSPDFNIPDPLLVPKDKLNDIIAAPGREIPALLIQRPELRLPEAFAYPAILQDPDILVISLSQLENILENKLKQQTLLTSPKTKDKLGKNSSNAEQSHYNNQGDGQPKPIPSMDALAGDIDAATSAALNQMLWLPYLSQLEAAVACSQNMDFLKALNSSGYSGHNYPDLSQMFNPSSRFVGPSGFPMMPPLDYENRLQFAMWQEAMNHPNSNSSQRPKHPSMDAQMKDLAAKSADVQNPYVHSTKNHQSKPHSSARTSPIAHNYNNSCQRSSMNHNPFMQGMYPNMNPNGRSNVPLPGLQIPYFNPNMMGNQRSPRSHNQQKSPTSQYFQNNNYLQAVKHSAENAAAQQQRNASSGSLDGQRPRISVKSLQNLLDPAAAAAASGVGTSGRRPPNSMMGRRREEPEVGSTTPLGEPPSHLQPHPHDPIHHLWHPLFGNQKGYNSPWSWTTVTATGD